MKLSNSVKKGSAAVTVALGLSILAPVSAEVAYAETKNTETASQQLIDSLEALNLDNTDYLYSYLQYVELSENELNKINANTKRAQQILSTTSVENLPKAQKTELLRLFNENVKLAHLQATITNADGEKLNVLDYTTATGQGLKIQLLDLDGNVLATVDPKKEDLNPAVLNSKIVALNEAVEAKKVLDEVDAFVPMPEAELPNTATDNPTYILMGSLLALMGVVALVPAAKVARRMN